MGCDIHLKVQKWNVGHWENTEAPRPCSDCKGAKKRHDGQPCIWCDGRGEVTGFGTRTYDTFAILADVRNGDGGQDDDPFIPIALPRGLPQDLKFARVEAHYFGDHSFSWLMLSELIAYPHWEAETTKRGWISQEEFARWDAKDPKDFPSGWIRSTGGGGVRHISNDQMRAVLAGGPAPSDPTGAIFYGPSSYYTLVEWRATYARCASEFHDDFIPALLKVGAPNEVRIVFGFDS